MITEELIPVYKQLKSEGHKVYSYHTHYTNLVGGGEIHSLYWYENGRILDIQPSTWRNKYNRDCYHLSTAYIPNGETGSGVQVI